jgi:hypothetical protein
LMVVLMHMSMPVRYALVNLPGETPMRVGVLLY